MRRKSFERSSATPNSAARLHPGALDRFVRSFEALIMVALAGLIAATLPLLAQTQASQMPANAQAKSYGDGWECIRGFRQDGDACLATIVPENAYATNRTYGSGWACLHGYREVDSVSCLEVIVPDGGYLDPSGNSWSCHRGYMKVDDICLEIVLPSNAYLADRKTDGNASGILSAAL